MAYLLSDVINSFNDLIKNYADPRIKDWFMMGSPIPTILISVFYAYFAKVIGPKLMKNRRPFVLREVLIVYNLFQVFLSAWLFYELLASGWWNDYSFRCQHIDFSTRPKAMRMAAVCWWYYMSKFTELLDTIFFVMRKKNNQISTLHVIHHGVMPVVCWFGLRFAPGGHHSFFGLLNTFVHIIMYGYYFLAALGPKIQPYLWWKKYLTSLQMIQFICILIHEIQLLFIECPVSKIFTYQILILGSLFLYLFGKFYVENYKKESKERAKRHAD